MKINTLFVFVAFVSTVFLAGCSSAGAGDQVTGTVFYVQRIALPPDAKLTVRVSDVSIADAPAEIIGEVTYATEGKQVPLPFAVAYDKEAINPSRIYAVSARIEDVDGKLLFISDTVHPVITNDHPTQDVEIKVIQVQ